MATNAKKNDKEIKEVVETTNTDNQGAASTDNEQGTTQDSTVENTTIQENAGGSPDESASESQDNEQNPKMDTKGKSPRGRAKNGNSSKDKEIDEKRQAIADDVFKVNPKSKTLYFTSDLIPFFAQTDALRHAGRLEDNTIVTVNKK